MSALTLVLSACGVSEARPPVEEEMLLEVNQLEIVIPELELPGCTLPSLDTDFLEEFEGCIFWGCIRYEAGALQ
jgi:hypothetical protein